MKKYLLRGIVCLLSVALLTGAVPVVAAAVDNELVLSKIGHTSTDTLTLSNPSTRAVTLTVPYKFYGTTLDLSSGLIIEKAPTVSAAVTQISAGVGCDHRCAGSSGPEHLSLRYILQGLRHIDGLYDDLQRQHCPADHAAGSLYRHRLKICRRHDRRFNDERRHLLGS